jgi:hypothetical protein
MGQGWLLGIMWVDLTMWNGPRQRLMTLSLLAHEISESVCKAINTKITGSDTVPALAGASSQDLLVDDSLHGGSNANFMVVNCAACDEKPALCVSSGGTYTFYSVLVAD